jgi:hypothetical protein
MLRHGWNSSPSRERQDGSFSEQAIGSEAWARDNAQSFI